MVRAAVPAPPRTIARPRSLSVLTFARVLPAIMSFMAWVMSDAGKAYMRTSAKAWAEAHIAGGENPDVARGMADRTIAAYTGAPPAES